MSLVLANPRQEWGHIRGHLKPMVLALDQGMLVDDVYVALSAGTASLYLSADGFVIVRKLLNPSCGRDMLLVWFACCYDGTVNAIAKYEPFLVDLARQHKCRGLVMETDRRGFERKLPDPWYMRSRWYREV